MNQQKKAQQMVLDIIDPLSTHKISVLDVATGKRTTIEKQFNLNSLEKKFFDLAFPQIKSSPKKGKSK